MVNTAQKPGSRSWQRVWRLLVLAVVAAAAWRFIDFGEVAHSLAQIRLPWLIGLLVLATLDRFMMAAKWLHLLLAAGVPASLRTALDAYYQASFMQELLPSSLGGDALRGFIVVRRHGQAGAVLAAMLLEKVLGMLAALLIALSGAILLVQQVDEARAVMLVWLIPAMIAVTIGALWLSFNRSLAGWLSRRLPGQRLPRAFDKIYTAYSRFRDRQSVIPTNLLLCLIEQSLQVVVLVGCARAIGSAVEGTVLISAFTIGQFLRKFAILAEGWVLGQFTAVVVYSLLGLPSHEALVVSLLAYALGIVAASPGAWLFARSGGELGSWREAVPRLRAFWSETGGGAGSTGGDR